MVYVFIRLQYLTGNRILKLKIIWIKPSKRLTFFKSKEKNELIKYK